jgi:hypothetical protein
MRAWGAGWGILSHTHLCTMEMGAEVAALDNDLASSSTWSDLHLSTARLLTVLTFYYLLNDVGSGGMV